MSLSIPPPLMVSEPGSFAEQTIAQRKPTIIADVLANNRYGEETVRAIRALELEIATCQPVEALRGPGEDLGSWAMAMAPWRGCSWFELPWYLAETFFYRRLLDAIGYWSTGPTYLHDPFAAQKMEALEDGLRQMASALNSNDPGESVEGRFFWWLRRCLWGNRADLSNKGAKDTGGEGDAGRDVHVLVDHSRRLWARFGSGYVDALDVVTDNAGPELLSDLGLVNLLLSEGLVQRVRLHLKPQPFFVSDAMIEDLDVTVRYLCEDECPMLRALGQSVAAHRNQGRLAVETHPFWATSGHYADLPHDLASRLGEADLVLFKGDVNYRRLVSDAHWRYTDRLEEIVDYMPSDIATVRTIKAELIVGLRPGQAERIAAGDPRWLIDGNWGVIHAVDARDAGSGE